MITLEIMADSEGRHLLPGFDAALEQLSTFFESIFDDTYCLG
jgi:hypothetical protein